MQEFIAGKASSKFSSVEAEASGNVDPSFLEWQQQDTTRNLSKSNGYYRWLLSISNTNGFSIGKIK